jgi:hypothetical protein
MNNGGNPGTCDPQWLNCQNNCWGCSLN